MSAPNLPLELDSASEPISLVLRRLVRALDYAEGFWLGFVKCNSVTQRQKAVAACKDILQSLRIYLVEVDLRETVSDLIPILKNAIANSQSELSGLSVISTSYSQEISESLDKDKIALFIYGLENSIPSQESYPPIFSYLNLNRELFRQEIPYPMVLWLPDYALTALARHAPDFWAWRSGFYEIAPEVDIAERTLESTERDAIRDTERLSAKAKRQRLVSLKELLADYRGPDAGRGERELQSDILFRIGLIYNELGDGAEAKRNIEESLAIARKLADQVRVARFLHILGNFAHDAGEYIEARRLYAESMRIARDSDDKGLVAVVLHELGALAQDTGNYWEARRFYEESLQVINAVGDKLGMAVTLHDLGRLAQNTGNYIEAQRLYEESLRIKRELGIQSGAALTTAQLGRLAEINGDYVKAMQLWTQALQVFQQTESPNARVVNEWIAKLREGLGQKRFEEIMEMSSR